MATQKIFCIPIAIILIVFFSCKSREKDYNNEFTYTIDIRNSLNQKSEQILLSDFADKIKYVPLETNKYCLLSKKISYLDIYKNNIYITDSHILYQFDLSGRFIRQIGKTGKGPGEYGRNIKFKIDTIHNEILIFSYPRKVLVFDITSGEFERSFNVNFEVANFKPFLQDRFLFFTKELNLHTTKSSLNEVYLTDKNGNVIDSISDNNRAQNRNNVIGYVHLYDGEENQCYMGCYKDILYRLDDRFIKRPYVKFNLNNKIEWNELIIEPNMNNRLADHVFIYNPIEIKNYFFLSVQIGIPSVKDTLTKLIYEKQYNNVRLTNGLRNDLDRGVSFWPQFVVGDKLISYYQAYELREYIKNNEKTLNRSNELFNIGNILQESDNPVLVIAELKGSLE